MPVNICAAWNRGLHGASVLMSLLQHVNRTTIRRLACCSVCKNTFQPLISTGGQMCKIRLKITGHWTIHATKILWNLPQHQNLILTLFQTPSSLFPPFFMSSRLKVSLTDIHIDTLKCHLRISKQHINFFGFIHIVNPAIHETSAPTNADKSSTQRFIVQILGEILPWM